MTLSLPQRALAGVPAAAAQDAMEPILLPQPASRFQKITCLGCDTVRAASAVHTHPWPKNTLAQSVQIKFYLTESITSSKKQ